MNRDDFDAALSAWADLGDQRLPAHQLEAALARIERAPQRGDGWSAIQALVPARAAAWATLGLAIAALAAGVGIALRGPDVGGPPPGTASPVATQSPSMPVTPSPLATPFPSLSAEALTWSPDRTQEDWPLPVRSEVGEPRLVALEPQTGDGERLLVFTDPAGDVGSSVPGWLDITEVRISRGTGGSLHRVEFVVAELAPLDFPDPQEAWISYGLVVDTDADGKGDLRLGMDNAPDGEHRAWWTDLDIGATEATTGGPYGGAGDHFLDTFLPGEVTNGGEYEDGEAPFGRILVQPDDVDQFRFYVWASMLEAGQVVATDYAPDVGWLDPRAATE